MKNLQLVTTIITLLLSLMFYQVVAQRNDFAQVTRHAGASKWAYTAAPESVNSVTNPLTARFSVLPKITVNDDGNVFVYIYNPNRIDINVSIHDEGGNTLHHDKTATLYYGKLLNMSELIAGEYMLTLNSEAVSARYVVKIKSEAREIKVKQVAVF